MKQLYEGGSGCHATACTVFLLIVCKGLSHSGLDCADFQYL